jgi:hypothetical protein
MFLLPRSMLTIDHLPPLCFFNWSWRSLKVLLCLHVRILALYFHPPRRCVLVSGWLHLVYSIGPYELSLLASVYVWSPSYFIRIASESVWGLWEGLYAKVCSCTPCFLKESPEYSLGCKRFFGVFQLLFLCLLWGWWVFEWFLVCLGECVLSVAMCGGPRLVGPLHQMWCRCGLSVPNRSCRFIGCFIVLHIRMRFDLPYVCFSCLESLSRSGWFVSCKRPLWRCWL